MSQPTTPMDLEYRVLWLLAHDKRREKGEVVITQEALALAPPYPGTSIFQDAKTGNFIVEPDGECPFAPTRIAPSPR